MSQNRWDLNGSGYVDPTAFGAFKTMIKPAPHPGEIWAQTTSGERREVLVIARGDHYFNILNLSDDARKPVSVVSTSGIKHTTPGMVRYAKFGELDEFVRKLPDAEFRAIVMQVGTSLGIPMRSERDAETIVNQRRKLEEQAAKIAELQDIIRTQNNRIEDAQTPSKEEQTELLIDISETLHKILEVQK